MLIAIASRSRGTEPPCSHPCFDKALNLFAEGLVTQLPASLLTTILTALALWGVRKWRAREK